jgi:hypothetical protein
LPAECLRSLHREPVDGREVAPVRLSVTIDAYFSELNNETNRPWYVFESDPRTLLDYPTPPTEEDIRIHAWLTERLAALDRERHGLWPRILRFLRGITRLWKL